MFDAHRVGGVNSKGWLVGVRRSSVLLDAVKFPDDVVQGVNTWWGGGKEAGFKFDVCGEQWVVDDSTVCNDIEVGASLVVVSDPDLSVVVRCGVG